MHRFVTVVLLALLGLLGAACTDAPGTDAPPPAAAEPATPAVPSEPAGDDVEAPELDAPDDAEGVDEAEAPAAAGDDVGALLESIEASDTITVEQVRQLCTNGAIRELAAAQLESVQEGSQELFDQLCEAVGETG